ncbi:MAG TPA: DUF177 domain-containing protein [Actinomycetota bacterium]|jgi:uncharacterized protein
MSGLLVDVGSMVGRPGTSREIVSAERIPGLVGTLGWVEENDPVRLELTAESVLEGIEVTGWLSGRLRLRCSRCLADYEEPFRQAVDEIFYLGTPPEEEGYQVTGDTIDLEPMVRDLVVLAIPVVPIHSEDCRGLCPECGADLNVVDCGHRSESADSRWAPLMSLEGLLGSTEEE